MSDYQAECVVLRTETAGQNRTIPTIIEHGKFAKTFPFSLKCNILNGLIIEETIFDSQFTNLQNDLVNQYMISNIGQKRKNV